MKEMLGYYVERFYPYLVGSISTCLCYYLKMDMTDGYSYKDVLNGLITLDSIIIGFLGAIMPVVLSMKNESKFVKYVFEKDKKNLFSKYMKATIFLGLIDVLFSLVMYVRGIMPVCVRNLMYYFWIFLTLSFILSTYRSLSHMINLIFAKDYDTGEGITQNSMNDEAREKIREKYRAKK